MAILEDLIDLIQGMAADRASPFPGFFTITAIAEILLSRGSLSDKSNEGIRRIPSRRQLQYVRNLILKRPDLFEIKRIRGQTYFRLS